MQARRLGMTERGWDTWERQALPRRWPPALLLHSLQNGLDFIKDSETQVYISFIVCILKENERRQGCESVSMSIVLTVLFKGQKLLIYANVHFSGGKTKA